MSKTYSLVQGTYLYSINLQEQQSNVTLKLTQASLVDCWTNSLTASYIEDATAKTGFKITFAKFSQHLQYCLSTPTQHNYVQVLTSHDVEHMKAKKGLASSQSATTANKRYLVLILTLSGNKFHYPLPLNLVQCTNKQLLNEAILKLQANLPARKKQTSMSSMSSLTNKSNTTDFQADQIKRQNEQLKNQILLLQKRAALKRGAVQMDQLLKNKLQIQTAIKAMHNQKNRKLQSLKAVIQGKQKQLNSLSIESDNMRREIQKAQNNDPNAMNRLKNYAMKAIKITQFQVNSLKKLLTKLNREKANHIRKLDQAKAAQKKTLAKIKKLIADIEGAKKRTNLKEISNRLSKGTSSVTSKMSGQSGLSGNSVRTNIIARPAGTRSQKSQTSQKSGGSVSSKPKSNASYNQRARPVIPPSKPKVIIPLAQTNLRKTVPSQMVKAQSVKAPQIKSNTLTRPIQPPSSNKSLSSKTREPLKQRDRQRSADMHKKALASNPSKLNQRAVDLKLGKGNIESKLSKLNTMIQKAKKD